MRIANMDLSLENNKEAKKYFQLLLISKYEKFPFFTNMLINMADIEDVHPENKETSLAYTYYDHHLERLKIRLNYDWIENGILIEKPGTNVIEVKPHDENKTEDDGDNVVESGTKMSLDDISNGKYSEKIKVTLSNDNVLFLIYHELLHNYFHHFSRHERYREKYARLANIVEDYYINEFLVKLFACIPQFDRMPKELAPIMYEELNNIALQNCKQPLPFTAYEEKPLESTLIDWFIKHEDEWEDKLKDNSKQNGIGKGNRQNGTGDHDLSEEYSERTLSQLNDKRQKEGRSVVNKEQANSISTKKMDEGAENAKEMSGKNMSKGETDCLRHKEKILKKNPFLNYVKITNTLKKMMIKGVNRNYSKPNRRRSSNSIVYKGKSKEEGLHIVVGIDVSGSVSDNELKKIYDMLGTFLEKNAKETSIDIFYWSSCRLKDGIHFHRDIRSSKELLGLKINSSGGTILDTAHNLLIEKYGKTKIQFLNISDGYFEYSPIPSCVTDYYFCLTEDGMFNTVSKWFPKAKIRVCRTKG